MNIHNVSLTISAVRPNQYPTTGYMEFAFAGRSNVGKSSMINKLLNRKSLARVSGTPGKTITINFYNIEPLGQTILLVDSRHKPTKDDITMANWIRHYHTNLIVVATKMDKLKKREIEPNLQRIWETLEMGEDDILVPFSTQDDEGKYTVWDMIEMMRAGELYYSDDEESEETEE